MERKDIIMFWKKWSNCIFIGIIIILIVGVLNLFRTLLGRKEQL